MTKAEAGFWAIGKDCCRARGGFSCGPVYSQVNSGVVKIDDYDRKNYALAVEMASSTYGLRVPEGSDPIMVFWGMSKSTMMKTLIRTCWTFCLWACLIVLGVIFVVILVLAYFQSSLTANDKISPSWYPNQVSLMHYGFNVFSQRKLDDEEYKELLKDFLCNKAYWSGEILYDYSFHMANRHMFISCFACHPEHPYSKWERLTVLAIIIPLIVWPVAAMTTAIGNEGFMRTVLVLMVVTIPRNLLRMYLLRIAVEDANQFVFHGARIQGQRVFAALVWELIFIFCMVLSTFIICCICSIYITRHIADPLLQVLARNTDGILYAIVLEPIFDLILPNPGSDPVKRNWTIGFIGNWLQERSAAREQYQQAEEFSMRHKLMLLPSSVRLPTDTSGAP